MILSLDLGSTTVKCALFTGELDCIARSEAKIEYVQGTGGQVEIAVDTFSKAVRQAIADVQTGPGRSAAIRSVALTGQAQTFTLCSADGTPLMNFISWQDARARAAAEKLVQHPELKTFQQHASSCELQPALQASQLFRLREEGGLDDAGQVVSLAGWLTRNWTGVNAMDENQAAMTGLYSLCDGRWWAPMCSVLGVSEPQLPQLIPVGGVAARTRSEALEWGLPEGIPVVLAGNDQTAGACGARVETRGFPLATLGTAQVFYTWLPGEPRPVGGGFRGPYPGGGSYRLWADSLGGNLVNWLQTILSGCETDEAFFRAAARCSSGWPELRAADASGNLDWSGLCLQQEPGHLARAALEFLVQRFADGVRKMEPEPFEAVLVAGGGGRQPLWRDCLSGALGVECIPTQADPLLGAARMARVQLT